ncbi:acyltransferase [Danxiaibacter flavus]|uniref:Acyltransferase n=1 Tax=Danxiaibacter flavus TaxID=3049108 RepID=A0ABV3ZEK3_9BACT|nr:acyltransferase [Chitinophagaceae bacterium DXS]
MIETAPRVDLLKTKQHFEILDGLRGIAAVSVVIFHFMEIAVPDYTQSFIAHSYLAVDFFFCLSGFVIAYAYDNRLQKIGVLSFLKLRLIRLHPLVIIGSIIGLLAFIFDPFSNLHQQYADKLLPMFIASCLMIPYPVVRERFFNLFHLNPPTWSLFWEYVVNIVYAIVLIRLPKKILWVLLVIAAGALAYEARRSTNLSGGWGGDNILGGLIRVSYSFLAGILVYRSRWIIQSKLGFLSVGILTVAAFVVPFVKELNWIVDPAIVIFYLPFLVALGAGATLRPAFAKICRFSGEISYPLYMVHYPFIWIFMSYVEKYKPNIGQMTPIIITGTIAMILLAYIVMISIDIPVRKWLKNRMMKKAA